LKDTVLAEYVWLGGENELRGKTKVLHGCKGITKIEDLEAWNYDGSSTKQASGDNSEVFIKPVRLFKDPFRGAPNIIVLCETYNDLAMTKPNRTNFRYFASKIFDACPEEKPWFGIEQEYCIMSLSGNQPWPLGFPNHG
jgi:glutamine synthetase